MSFLKATVVLLIPVGGDQVDHDRGSNRPLSTHSRDLFSSSEQRIARQLQQKKGTRDNP